MANKRASGQALLGFWADPELALRVDAARGHSSRSQFLRDALAEKLANLGIDVPRGMVVAPDRAGKGGQPSHRKNRQPAIATETSDAPSSFPVGDSVTFEKTGQKRSFSGSAPAAYRVSAQPSGPVGSEYQAPSATVPPQKREVPAEILPGHTPEERDAILASIPVAMRLARERKATDDKREAYRKEKAEKKAAEEVARKARAAEWHAKQAGKAKTK